MLWLIYIIGIVLAIACAKVLRMTLFKGDPEPFVMELPPYRVPTARGVLVHMWERSWLYLKKAGTIILGVSIVLWAMTSYPKKAEFDQDYDALAEQAEAKRMAGLREAVAGLGAAAPLAVAAIEAEDAMAAKQGRWHEHQPAYAEAQEVKGKEIAMLTGSPGGDVVARWLEVRDAVLEARAAFDEAVGEQGLEDDSPEYAALAAKRDGELSALRDKNPQVYPSVLRYLDDVQAPYDEATETLEMQQGGEELSYSIAGRVGRGMAPLLRPLGFDWRIGTALIGAFAAKEVFVAQMGIVYSLGEADEGSESLRETLRENYTPLVGFCIMLFCLVSAPCMATIAVTKREANSWGWALFQLGGLTALAYVLTLLAYQIGSLAGIGTG
jgi:ferrous iron transport protein B